MRHARSSGRTRRTSTVPCPCANQILLPWRQHAVRQSLSRQLGRKRCLDGEEAFDAFLHEEPSPLPKNGITMDSPCLTFRTRPVLRNALDGEQRGHVVVRGRRDLNGVDLRPGGTQKSASVNVDAESLWIGGGITDHRTAIFAGGS